MKKSTMLLIVALGIGLTGCSTYIPFSYPENSLNTYNSYWDDFAGSIEEGKVYHYSNKGFSPKLQFTVLQVIDDKTILITRSSEYGYPYEGARYTKICESALFLVIPKEVTLSIPIMVTPIRQIRIPTKERSDVVSL